MKGRFISIFGNRRRSLTLSVMTILMFVVGQGNATSLTESEGKAAKDNKVQSQLNQEIMKRYREKMRADYYAEKQDKTYMDQLGMKYPTDKGKP